MGNEEVLEHINRNIEVVDTVSILGRYTKYRTNQGIHTDKVRDIEGYDKHTFGVVFKLIRVKRLTTYTTRIYFITDLGVNIFQDPSKLRVHYGERGNCINRMQSSKLE